MNSPRLDGEGNGVDGDEACKPAGNRGNFEQRLAHPTLRV
jgi:hypothetical protein